MRKIWVVAAREYQASVRTKSFIISLVLMPVLMGGSILIQIIMQSMGDLQHKEFKIIDRTGVLFPLIEKAAEHPESVKFFNPERNGAKTKFIIKKVEPGPNTPEQMNAQRFRLSKEVRDGEIFGFAEIGADVTKLATTQPGKSTPERF